MFSGLSTLRTSEKKEQPVSSKAKALRAYLASQYGAGDAEPEKRKKKKKKRDAGGPGIRILDEDVSGFATAGQGAASQGQLVAQGPSLASGDDAEEDEDDPVVVNAEEAERLKLLVEREKQFFKQRDDGSGWAVAGTGASTGSGDASPPRRAGRYHNSDASPPRRERHDSPDALPPRRSAADASPPGRAGRHNSPDASPPRRQHRHDSPDASPPRRHRHDSSGASPPRKSQHDSQIAASAGRRRHDSVDASPPRRHRASPDASPTRRSGANSQDASPPRRQRGAADAPPLSKRRTEGAGEEEDEAAAKKRRMMSDGTVAGMMSGRELMAEMQRKREQERQRFAELEADVTGRGAQTVFRDKEGRRVSKEEYLEQQAAAKKKAQYDSEQQLEWGGGLKQRVDAEERAAAMAAEASKPFARGRDDVELDAMHRGRSRWGDPMAGLLKAKVSELEPLASLVDRQTERLKKSGFVIPQEVPKHSWLRRGLGPPPNRYNIRPGRHWDGVDRGNGFEREMFKRQNELKRREQEAYMWAQEDM